MTYEIIEYRGNTTSSSLYRVIYIQLGWFFLKFSILLFISERHRLLSDVDMLIISQYSSLKKQIILRFYQNNLIGDVSCETFVVFQVT